MGESLTKTVVKRNMCAEAYAIDMGYIAGYLATRQLDKHRVGETERADNNHLLLQKLSARFFVYTMCSVSTFSTSPNKAGCHKY